MIALRRLRASCSKIPCERGSRGIYAVQADAFSPDAFSPKTINDEVLLLLRLCGDQGDLIRAKLRREKAMKLALPPSPGRAYTADEKARMLAEAAKLRS